MAKYTCTLEELPKLLAQHGALRDKRVRKAIQRVARRTLKYIQDETVPVDTGRLKKSGRVFQTGQTPTVAFTAPYAAFVEHGTRMMAPRHYMLRGAQKSKEFLAEELADALTGDVMDAAAEE